MKENILKVVTYMWGEFTQVTRLAFNQVKYLCIWLKILNFIVYITNPLIYNPRILLDKEIEYFINR